MSEIETIQSEVAKAMTRAHPPLIMSLEDVALLIGVSYAHMRNDVQNHPEFPPRPDRFKLPRWSRDSILEWAKV